MHAEHARVAQSRLDLDLVLELREDVVLLDLLLEDHLERNDGLRPLLAAEVDIPELAPSEGLADVEVGQRPDRCA